MKFTYQCTGLLLLGAGFMLFAWLFWPAAQWLWLLFITLQLGFDLSSTEGWFAWAIPVAISASIAAAIQLQKQAKRRTKPAKDIKERRTMANFEQYQNWVLHRIGQLVMEQQLHCQASAQRGPFTLNCTLRLTADPVAGLRKLLALGPSLRMILQTNVRIVQADQGVIIEAELPPQAHITPNAAKLVKATRWPQIAIGLDQFMRPVTINPELHGALYWVAPPRAGKTTSMRSTLYLICHAAGNPQGAVAFQARFLILAIASKARQDWGVFAGVSGCLGLVSDYAEMTQALHWVVGEMEAAPTGTPVPSQREPRTPFPPQGADQSKTIIVIDDLTMLMLHAPGIGPYIDSLALTGPGLGYHLMVGTHGAGSIATTGGRMTNFAMTCKLLYKPADNNTGARSSGRRNSETGLAQLSGAPGDAILDENGRITRIATAWVNDVDILALPAATHAPSYPWRNAPSRVTPSRVTAPAPTLIDTGATATPPTPSRDIPRDGVTRDALLAQVPAGLFPIKPVRDLDAEEADWVRTLFASGLFTESGLTMLVYGDRNPRRLARIRTVLNNDAPPPLTEREAAAILEGDPTHPRRSEALRFFNLVLSEENVLERSFEPCAN